jgi:beta-galactosidase GanA
MVDRLQSSANRQPPHLRRQGSATKLIVGGQPFLVLGGELHNSSASTSEYMRPIWERMVALNLNTVLAIVLWFGSWKNGVSSYVPGWVKRDYRRFELAKLQSGQTASVLSTFAEANWQADARAFAALMQHIRAVDGDAQTVIMVQVENEVGLLGDSRDRSEAVNRAFAAPVPAELLDQLQQQIDIFAPDICFGDFETWCKQYTRRGNPLFIPEMRRGADGARGLCRDWAVRGDRRRAIRHRLTRESR